MENVQINETKQILVTLGRLEENFKNMNAKIDELSKVSSLAVQTNESTKSAHNRIDGIKIDFDQKMKDQKEDYEEKIKDQKERHEKLEGHITWLWRTVGAGFIGLCFSLMLYFLKNGGGQ